MSIYLSSRNKLEWYGKIFAKDSRVKIKIDAKGFVKELWKM